MIMTSVSGAGAGSSLMQMARLSQIQPAQTAGAGTTATRSTGTSTSTSDTISTDASASDLVAELQSFFQSTLSSDTMGGLLQAQGDGHMGPPPGNGGPPSLSDIDTDGDGSISKTEFESFGASKSAKTSSASSTADTSKADEMFSKMDTNGDGSVSADEKTAFDKTMQTNHPSGPPPLDQASNGSDGTSSDIAAQSMADIMQQLLVALQSYASMSSSTSTTSATATSSTTTTSVAA
jgi:hypothetical protein